MTTTLNLATRTGAAEYPLTMAVYLKQRWADDWTYQDGMAVDKVIWAAAPRISTAQLYWRYGLGKLPDSLAFEQLARKSVSRWYCKINLSVESLLIPGAAIPMNWYGIVDFTRDIVEGIDLAVTSGRQALIAYGLESELYRSPILDCQFLPTGEITAERCYGGLECNPDGHPNRTPTKTLWDYYVFSEDTANASYWSTRDIIQYLMRDQMPKDTRQPRRCQRFDHVTVPFEMDPDALEMLPDWDAPQIELHGKTTGQVFNQLMARQRLLGWYVSVNELDPPGTVKVVPFTFTGTPITISTGKLIARNPNTFHLDLHETSEADVSVEYDSTGKFDQVIVEGAKRRSVFTVGAPAGWGYTLQAGWTAGLETEYEQAGSTDPDYPDAAEIDERRRRNAAVRNSDKLASVFSRFQIPATWNYKSGDGGGVTWYEVFPVDWGDYEVDDFANGQVQYRPSVTLLPTIPLLADMDYSQGTTGGDWLGVGDRHEEMAPIVLIQSAETAGKYLPIESAGSKSDLPRTDLDGNERWSASVRVNSKIREPAFFVNVGGQPQHVIGGADFTALDEDKALGGYDWRTMIATVAVEEDRRVYGAYPPARELPSLEIVRVMRIDAGAEYRLDYMPEGTVLGIDTAGELVKSPAPQWINDARTKLHDLAKFAYQWYGTERRILELSTRRIIGHLEIGDLIVSISRTAAENIDVGTCITQIVIDNPVTHAGAPPMATMSIATAYAELDPLKV